MKKQLRFKHSLNDLLGELDTQHQEYSPLLHQKIVNQITSLNSQRTIVNRNAILKPAFLFLLILLNVFTLVYFQKQSANNINSMNDLRENFRKEFGMSNNFENTFQEQ